MAFLVAGMGGELGGRKREDEPTATGIDRREPEDIAEERSHTLGVAGEDDRVSARDHAITVNGPEQFDGARSRFDVFRAARRGDETGREYVRTAGGLACGAVGGP